MRASMEDAGRPSDAAIATKEREGRRAMHL